LHVLAGSLTPNFSFFWGHECDKRTDDRQTDHAAEKSVGIGGIACTVTAVNRLLSLICIGLQHRKQTNTNMVKLTNIDTDVDPAIEFFCHFGGY